MEEELRSSLHKSSCLYELWLEGALADCELVCSDGVAVAAHRVVLAAASGFFRALFTGAWHQHQQECVPGSPLSPTCGGGGGGLQRFKLSGVDSASLRLLLHALYSKRLPLTAEGAAEEVPLLLAASNYLEVLPIKQACCQYLRSELSLQTVACTLALAAAHDCSDLLADAGRFFEGHFTQLLKSEEAASIAALPPDLLARLLSSDGLNIGSEVEVARAALLWAAADPAQRGPLLGELLPAARMPPGQLQEEAARGGLLAAAASSSSGSPSVQQQQQPQPQPQAKQPKYHHPQQPQQPQHQKQAQQGLDCGELGAAFIDACQQLQNNQAAAAVAAALAAGAGPGAEAGNTAITYRPRLSCATGLMMAGGLDDGWRPLRTVELYDPQRDCWAPGPIMPAPCSFAAAAMLGGQTYVVEGAAHAPSVLSFDRQQRRWAHCRGLATPRVNMAVCGLEERLYVLGGRAGVGKGAAVLSDVEVYDPATDSWQAAPPMALPRTSLAAAALGGRLYAVGGQTSRSTHDSVEWWEPGAGRWVQMGAAMQQPRKYHGLTAAGGRLIAVGGMTGARMRLAVAEALDPREGRWQALPPMSMARSSCGAAALHDCVYVVGGNIGMEINENYAGVEAWVSAAGRWRQCSPISHGRSGLSVAPF